MSPNNNYQSAMRSLVKYFSLNLCFYLLYFSKQNLFPTSFTPLPKGRGKYKILQHKGTNTLTTTVTTRSPVTSPEIIFGLVVVEMRTPDRKTVL